MTLLLGQNGKGKEYWFSKKLLEFLGEGKEFYDKILIQDNI